MKLLEESICILNYHPKIYGGPGEEKRRIKGGSRRKGEMLGNEIEQIMLCAYIDKSQRTPLIIMHNKTL